MPPGPGKYDMRTTIIGTQSQSKIKEVEWHKISKSERFNSCVESFPGPGSYKAPNIDAKQETLSTFKNSRSYSLGKSPKMASTNSLSMIIIRNSGAGFICSSF